VVDGNVIGKLGPEQLCDRLEQEIAE
jgi:hypothetical protein